MKLIVGLGNPGIEYANTRHNAGFMFCEALINEHGLSELGLKFKSIAYGGLINKEKVIVLKPLTYMNLSGEAVLAAKQFYKISDEDILIAYDDFELPLGTVRLKPKGSAGTHNGMKDIIARLSNTEIPRIRIGIGPKPAQWATKDFVLNAFSNEEMVLVEETLKRALEGCSVWVKESIDAAMRISNKAE